jgi:hypothetical protein
LSDASLRQCVRNQLGLLAGEFIVDFLSFLIVPGLAE